MAAAGAMSKRSLARTSPPAEGSSLENLALRWKEEENERIVSGREIALAVALAYAEHPLGPSILAEEDRINGDLREITALCRVLSQAGEALGEADGESVSDVFYFLQHALERVQARKQASVDVRSVLAGRVALATKTE